MAAPKKKANQTYRVKAKRDSRRRAGEEFTREERTLELTPEQVAAIEADPVLVIEMAE